MNAEDTRLAFRQRFGCSEGNRHLFISVGNEGWEKRGRSEFAMGRGNRADGFRRRRVIE